MNNSLKKLTKYTNYLLGSLLLAFSAHLVWTNTTEKEDPIDEQTALDPSLLFIPSVYADVPVGDGSNQGDCGDGGGGGDCGG